MEGRIIAYKTYVDFAKKYGIKITTKTRNKTMNELARQIYNYEKRNNIKNGLYF